MRYPTISLVCINCTSQRPVSFLPIDTPSFKRHGVFASRNSASLRLLLASFLFPLYTPDCSASESLPPRYAYNNSYNYKPPSASGWEGRRRMSVYGHRSMAKLPASGPGSFVPSPIGKDGTAGRCRCGSSNFNLHLAEQPQAHVSSSMHALGLGEGPQVNFQADLVRDRCGCVWLY